MKFCDSGSTQFPKQNTVIVRLEYGSGSYFILMHMDHEKAIYTDLNSNLNPKLVVYPDAVVGGSSPGRVWEFFSSPPRPESTQPHIQWLPAALSLGIKRPVREADHSVLSNAEVKNAWGYTSTTPMHLHVIVLC
jgi:hypothetical protein